MATPHFLSTFIKSLLLSLVLISCFTEQIHAFDEEDQAHFHTIQISSLSPASICTPSKDPIKKRPSTLEVFHRHGPCSKLHTTTRPSLKDVLSHDQSRVESIHARLNPNPTTTKVKETKTNLPAQPGASLGSGNYLVTVSLGTPKKPLSLIFDTGSDLTWTQCQPCSQCYKQQDPIFDPSSSTSYSNTSCTSSTCSQLFSATGNSPSCSPTGTCVYRIQYGDRSTSTGFLSKDTLTVANDVFPNFQFGCGQDNKGLFGRTAGLIGLGKDPLSIVSQTAAKYGKYFSYCLPASSSSKGHLSFGRGGGAPRNVKFTPFDASQGSVFYFITIVSISVGGTQLPISQSVFQTAGTIIDSGTVITRLPPTAYSALSSAFKKQMTMYPAAPAYSILDTCYDFSNYTTVTIPTVSFTFGGGVKLDTSSTGILVAVGGSQACLAYAGNSDDGDVGIFGNSQQTTFEVVYDVAGGKLGFGSGGC